MLKFAHDVSNRRNVMRFTEYKLATTVCMLTALAGFALPSAAAENSAARTSKSISYSATAAADETGRKAELDQAEPDSMDALVKQGFRTEAAPAGVHVDSIVYIYEGDISVYDASTTLISDFDHDGFYHRFSVGIDADTVYATSYVYAELYLSYEGGPWNYYASSDAFHIHGDSALDVFYVETELAEGFPAGYYDVRIELYDADTGEWLLNYGPYDDSSLTALPLEDSMHDDDYYSTGYTTEVIVAGHGGMSAWLLAVFGLAGVFRIVARMK
jgi:hypothetical protein